ncbi:1-acylglycerol-3-phosphate O [Sistotremastrum suecicum HHB10207 ss-3]|uniref:1-acyl-sn-glycerol-3-phosphate acyltransferase n=1 Tax=Sistotremastrum suecicum HHB10207 ss-3 TaxID=1314776 RepID=A0A166HPM9_9AGAM|nr:1-acylglycerol-3-phosphate O [Sistotremastrum suecicum HHB10207 ss-3]
MSLVSFFLKPVAYLSLPIFVLHSLSKQSPMIRYYVRVALYLSTLGLASAWGVIVSIGMTLIGRRFDINYIVARSFHFLAGNAMGIKFQLEGEEHLDSVRPAILVGNHQSMLDILYLGRILPKRSSILAKKELLWTPILGQFMLLSGAVFVDRGNSKKALQSLAAAGATMNEQQTAIWIFPEGTRTNQEAPDLLPFKKGAFHLAVQAGAPVIPVVCENYWKLYRKGVFEPGTLKLRVLPPIPTTGLTAADVNDLATRTREQMLAVLREISSAVPGSTKPSEEAADTSKSQTPTPSETTPLLAKVDSSEGSVSGAGERPESATFVRKQDWSETSSVGNETEEDEGMILVGRPSSS